MENQLIHHLSGILSYMVPVLGIITSFITYTQFTRKETMHNFIFKEKHYYPEYNVEAYLYTHSIHGCPFIHIETNDTHNFFATTFRTTCIDDTGSTHVLEHMSLHGSDNYPINSVFSELLKRSLATLLNAFTSIEWTAYPFSTTNSNDFFNILNVYLDASFHPQLNQVAFESECHHLEFEVPNDTSTALHHSGVVYNEMVGSLSKPSDFFESLIRKNLYPNSLFRLEYGGYPPSIANLTLGQLKEMHDMYYHPSNALFFHYGSFDVDRIMAKIDQVISDTEFDKAHRIIYSSNAKNAKKDLSENIYQQRDDDQENNEINDGNFNQDRLKIHSKSGKSDRNIRANSGKSEYFDLEKYINQPRWDSPRFVVADGPSNGQVGENGEEKVTVSISWMVGDLRNISEITDLQFLSLLLTDTILSPLYKSLISTRIGTNFINTGFMNYMRSPYFCIGLEGVNLEDAVKFNQTVLNILNDVYKNGFDTDRIYSTLHNFEINQKTVSSERGINFWESLITFWIHNVDPFEVLDENWQIERIKRILKINPRYFEMILKHHLINNNHRLDLIMKGVQNFQEKQAENVKKELVAMKEKMTQKELDQIVDETSKIRQFVDAPRPVHLLPSITVKDINSTQPSKVTVDYPLGNGQLMSFDQPTNGLVYLDVKCDIPVDSKDIELVPTLSLLLNQIGAAELDEDQLANQISLYTGGIHVSHQIIPSLDDPNSFKASLLFSGSALSADIEKFMKLFEKIITKPWLNNTKRINILLSEAVSSFPNRIAENGHSYAYIYSSAGLSKSATLQEMWNGVTGMRYMKKILNLSNAELKLKESNSSKESKSSKPLSDILNEAYFKNLVLSDNSSFSAAITCNSNDMSEMNKLVTSLLKNLPYRDSPSAYKEGVTNDVIEEATKEFLKHPKTHLKIDSSTFFCGVSIPAPSYNSEFSASYQVSSKLVQAEYLFSVIREKLGAYGAMSKYSSLTGTISFLSYRDTSPIMVLEAIHDIIESLSLEDKQSKFPIIDEQMVNRAIVQVFSGFDAPVAPKNAGDNMFLLNIDDKILQKRRTAYLNVNRNNVVKNFIEMASKIKEKNERQTIVGGKIDQKLIPDFHIVDVFDLEKKNK